MAANNKNLAQQSFLRGLGVDLKTVFVANCIIAVFLSILEYTDHYHHWLIDIGNNFIFSHSIGTSIYLVSCFSRVDQIRSRWLRLLGLLTTFVVGGWIGMFLGLALNHVIFGMEILGVRIFFVRITIFNVLAASTVYTFFVLRDKLHDTAARLAEKEVNEQRMLQVKTRAEFEALRAKVNPHFLFNTLNSIASLIPEDPVRAEEMVQKLADLFRYTLEASEQDMMRLSDEIEVVQKYLEIEKVRLGDRLNYTIDVDPDVADVTIPGLIIQPLAENSVKHGIAPKQQGGTIQITCNRNDGYCQVRIRDDGPGIGKKVTSNGFGLNGIRERLQLYYNDDYEFKVTDDQGLETLIRVPVPTPK